MPALPGSRQQRPHRIWQRFGFSGGVIHPDDFPRAFGVERVVARQADFVKRDDAASAGRLVEHLDFDGSRIDQRFSERATGLPQYRAFLAAVDGQLGAVEPFDPRLLHVAKKYGVVDMADSVHVAPTDGELHGDEVFFVQDDKPQNEAKKPFQADGMGGLYYNRRIARVAELVDAPDLGSGTERRGGSSPPFRTRIFWLYVIHSG